MTISPLFTASAWAALFLPILSAVWLVVEPIEGPDGALNLEPLIAAVLSVLLLAPAVYILSLRYKEKLSKLEARHPLFFTAKFRIVAMIVLVAILAVMAVNGLRL